MSEKILRTEYTESSIRALITPTHHWYLTTGYSLLSIEHRASSVLKDMTK
jgi:hypothetical protein